MRVTPDIKARYVTQARREGMKLSEWIQLHLNAVCDKAEADRQWEEKIAENNKYFRIYRKQRIRGRHLAKNRNSRRVR